MSVGRAAKTIKERTHVHNFVNHPCFTLDWSLADVAVQFRMGILSERRPGAGPHYRSRAGFDGASLGRSKTRRQGDRGSAAGYFTFIGETSDAAEHITRLSGPKSGDPCIARGLAMN